MECCCVAATPHLLIIIAFPLFCALQLNHPSAAAPPPRIHLLRADFASPANLSFADRMLAALARSSRRRHRLERRQLAAVPVAAAADGAFVARLAMGTPPREFRAIVDTGSDLVWQACGAISKEEEEEGGRRSGGVFDPAGSSTFRNASCRSAACSEVGGRCDDEGVCAYEYGYGEGEAAAKGWLAYDTLTVGGGGLQLPDFLWGCGLPAAAAEDGGVLGLGQGSLSLVSQISATRFSYCLARSAAPSPLFLGIAAASASAAPPPPQVTPIITNIFSPTFYYVNITGISINGTLLNIPHRTFSINQNNGSGGMIIDSGTTITYLEEKGYRIVQRAIQTYLSRFRKVPHPPYGVNLCYPFIQDEYLPKLTFHFQGADLDVPPPNLFLHLGDFTCLALGSSNGISILGNLQQQNYLLLYDLASRRISFTQTICDQLTKN